MFTSIFSPHKLPHDKTSSKPAAWQETWFWDAGAAELPGRRAQAACDWLGGAAIGASTKEAGTKTMEAAPLHQTLGMQLCCIKTVVDGIC